MYRMRRFVTSDDEREVDVRAVHGREHERLVGRDVRRADDLDATEQLGDDAG